MLLVVLLEFSDELADLGNGYIPPIVTRGQNMSSTVTCFAFQMDFPTNQTLAFLAFWGFIMICVVLCVSNWDVRCDVLLLNVIPYVKVAYLDGTKILLPFRFHFEALSQVKN